MKRWNALSLAAIFYCGVVGAAAQPVAATAPVAPAQAAVGLTVYQQGLALVRDERTLELGLGEGEVLISDVSGQIVPGSTQVNGQGSLQVKALHYVSANLTPQALLQRHVGRLISVLRTDPRTGAEVRQPATLLGVEGDRPIVRIDDRVEIGGEGAPWRLVFDEVPADLTGRDGLLLELSNQTRGPQSLELVYLSRGLSWQADYVGVLDPQGRNLRLSGWASIANDTGSTFDQARIQLVAGDIQQAARPGPLLAMEASRAQGDMARQAGFDYHTYALETPVTLTPGRRTQVSLLGDRQLPVEREYRVVGESFHPLGEPQELAVEVRLKLPNQAPTLGEPLPAGIVRIYGEAAGGQLQLLGEDRIDHTAVGEELELTVGRAFDLSGRRIQTSYRKIDQQTAESAWRLELRNAKNVPVTVRVEERLPGDWRVLEASQEPARRDAHSLEWSVEVPAGGTRELTYRVQTRF